MTFWSRSGSILLAVALAIGTAGNAAADPPPWAPAHGYRAKHGDHRHVGDIGILYGRCDRDMLGSLLGGAAGGSAGSQIGEGEGKVAATIGGIVIGAIVGHAIGDSMDRLDRACVGQALEHAEAGHTVQWREHGTSYAVTPAAAYRNDGGDYCRPFAVTALAGGDRRVARAIACRDSQGRWRPAR